MTRPATRIVPVLALTAALLVVPAAGARAAQGGADPSLTVSPTTLPADRISTVTVTGNGYLVPPHAPDVDVFGGVYVFFGWVADPDHFGPSIRNSGNNDGTVGVTYAYPGEAGDAATRDDGSGTMRLVSFTDGGESGEATGFHMDDDGNWTTTLRVSGATFTTTTPAGETRTYDCRQVRCGVFTIGAHGIASATNEQFAPIAFRAGTAPAAPSPAGGDDPAPDPPPTTGAPAAAPQPSPTGSPDLVPGTDGGGEPGSLAATTDSVRSTGGVSAPVLGVAAGLALAALAGGLWWRHRRRAGRNDHPTPESPTVGGGTHP